MMRWDQVENATRDVTFSFSRIASISSRASAQDGPGISESRRRTPVSPRFHKLLWVPAAMLPQARQTRKTSCKSRLWRENRRSEVCPSKLQHSRTIETSQRGGLRLLLSISSCKRKVELSSSWTILRCCNGIPPYLTF